MVRCLYKEVSGSRKAVVSVESAHHPIGQQITGPFDDDVNEPAEVVSYDPTPAFLGDGTIAEGGTVYVTTIGRSLQPS